MNSFMRNIGGSIGIALISTSIARIAQSRRYNMVAQTTPGSPAYEGLVGGLSQTLQSKGAGSVTAAQQAHSLVSFMIDRQATTLAYVEVISILAVIILSLVPFLLIMKRNRPALSGETAIH